MHCLMLTVRCKFDQKWSKAVNVKKVNTLKKVDGITEGQNDRMRDRRPRADNSVVGDSIWPKFELIQFIMLAFVTCYDKTY